MIRQAHLKLVASHSIRHGVRGGAGLISIFLTLITGLVLAQCTVAPLEYMDKQRNNFSEQLEKHRLDDATRAELQAQQQMIEQRTNDEVKKVAAKAIDWAIEPSPDQLKYLTEDHPAMITAFLALLMLFVPFLVCLAGFNQTSSDIDSKGLRFLLIRTERSNIFLGRLVGTYVFTALVFLFLFLIIGLYMGIKINVHPPGEMIWWLLQGYLRVMIFAAPYMAVCAWISCAIESAFGSLVIALLCVYVYPWIIALASKVQPAVAYGAYATPFGYKWWLFEPIGLKFFGGVGIMAAFTALFVYAGHRYFGKRDL